MGWNKRSFGNMYDYLSGHAFFIGCLSQKIITTIVTAKQCRTYLSHDIKGIEPPAHNCLKNYTGSLKAMEVDASLPTNEDVYFDLKKNIALQYIVSDDDSFMRALLKHDCNYPKGKSKLEIPEPDWLTDHPTEPKLLPSQYFRWQMHQKASQFVQKLMQSELRNAMDT